MKREDLRSRIIAPADITDLIYLDTYGEQAYGGKTDEERRISATDYAQMNRAYIDDIYTTRTGKKTTAVWLKNRDRIFCRICG